MPQIKGDKREKEIKIRVNKDEFKQLNDRKTTKSLASWMRNLCLGATPIIRADPELVRELGRIGSNLNQITKHANTQKELDSHILQGVERIEIMIRELIEDNKNASKNQ
ncbi:plasmid mobilization relaxosome protein MobC [Streptomyces sp. NPDC002138]|uniref:plasmid mobilization protein n=1 Tax=Streptomyces sp. NPDC002138 TaxID=3154410 RepID=UPI003318CB80